VVTVYIKRSKNHIETPANPANIRATFPSNTNREFVTANPTYSSYLSFYTNTDKNESI